MIKIKIQILCVGQRLLVTEGPKDLNSHIEYMPLSLYTIKTIFFLLFIKIASMYCQDASHFK